MITTRRHTLLFLLILISAPPLAAPWAAVPEPVTVAVAQPESLPPAERERLSPPVTVTADEQDLTGLVGELAQQTKLPITIDRELADLKVNIQVREMPLLRLMALVAELVPARWLRRGEPEDGRYALSPSEAWLRKRREWATAHAQARTEVERAFQTEARELLERQLAAWQERPPQDPGNALMARLLSRLPPETREQLLAACELTSADRPYPAPTPLIQVPVAALGDDARHLVDAVVGTVEGQARGGSGLAERFSEFHAPEQQVIGLVSFGWTLRLELSNTSTGDRLASRTGAVHLKPGEATLWDADVVGRPSSLPSMTPRPARYGPGSAAIRCLEAMRREPVWPPSSIPPAWERRTFDLALPAEKRRERLFGEQVHGSLRDAIEVLRDQGLTVLADHYSRPMGVYPSKRGPLAEVLKELAKQFGVSWKFDGDVLLIRHAHWYHWDRYEVPYRLLRRWEERWPRQPLQATTAPPDLELLAEIFTSLTPPQWQVGLAWHRPGHQGFNREVREMERLRRFLPFYTALSAAQRSRLRGEGLALAGLSPPQLQVLQRAGISPAARGVAIRPRSSGTGPQNAVVSF